MMVTVGSRAAVIQDLNDESTEDDNNGVLSRSLPVDATSEEQDEEDRQGKSINIISLPMTYHVPSSVPVVQPFTYHVPGAVYNVPSPLPSPPRTPASTVLLPMLGQTSGGARSDVPKASTRGNFFSSCFWLFEQCLGLDISEGLSELAEQGRRRRSLSPVGVTPAYLRYGFGPVPSVQYPIDVEGTGAGVPMPTTYGPPFWCGIFAWKCLPNINDFPINMQRIIKNRLLTKPGSG